MLNTSMGISQGLFLPKSHAASDFFHSEGETNKDEVKNLFENEEVDKLLTKN